MDKGIPKETRGSLSTDAYLLITLGLLDDYCEYVATYLSIFEHTRVLKCFRVG